MKLLPVAPDVVRTVAGNYQARVMLGWKESRGHRIRRRIKRTFATKREAEEFRDEAKRVWKYQTAGLVPPGQETAAGLNLEQLVENALRQMEILGREQVSIDGARRYSEILLMALGEAHPVPLNREDIFELIAWIKTHRRTKGTLLRHVLQLVRTIHRRGELRVPWTPPIRVETQGRRVLSRADLGRFLAALPPASVERAACFTALLTAARESEVCRLRVRDVDFRARTVTLTRRKGWSGNQHGPKIVPMVSVLAHEIQAYLATLPRDVGPDAPLLSITARGPRQSISGQSLARRLRSASRRAGLHPPVTSFGWLRNQAATLLGAAETPDKTLQRLLGHATPGMTERYNRAPLEKQQAAALRRLAGIVERGAKVADPAAGPDWPRRGNRRDKAGRLVAVRPATA